MKGSLRNLGLSVVAALVALPVSALAAVNGLPSTGIEKAVRHELVMLPYYNVFDDISYRVDPAGNVTLFGEVTRPTLKSDAQRAVQHVEGIRSVTNRIEVLPLSPFDDRIRIAVARAIYGYGPLQRYAMGAQPPIHIIVKNGNVRLEGVVANQFDRNVANMRANGVGGVFSVTNNLRIDNRS